MKSREMDHYSYHSDTQQRKIKLWVLNLAVTVVIMAFATFLSFLFRQIGLLESNIIMAFILGVLIVAKQTDGFSYGILASIIGVLTFNFFFY